MRAGISAAVIAASVISSSAGWAACVSTRAHNCVNLDLVPQVSDQVVGDEHIPLPRRNLPTATPIPNYTGPIVGVSPTVRQAPTVGYRWAID